MGYQRKTVALIQFPNLQPLAIFNPTNTFGQRIQQDRVQEKQMVACYVAQEFFSGQRTAAFVTDGSSTFYVLLAIVLNPQRTGGTICTNNLAISSELDARGGGSTLELQFLGGKKDPDLNATLGPEADRQAESFLRDFPLVISSVRELEPTQGPTAPELESRRLKREAMIGAGMLIIVLDWMKLATPPVHQPNLVFSGTPRQSWSDTLANKDVRLVCSVPPCLQNQDTYHLGQSLLHTLKPPSRLQDFEKYALNVFTLSQLPRVSFIEVGQ